MICVDLCTPNKHPASNVESSFFFEDPKKVRLFLSGGEKRLDGGDELLDLIIPSIMLGFREYSQKVTFSARIIQGYHFHPKSGFFLAKLSLEVCFFFFSPFFSSIPQVLKSHFRLRWDKGGKISF